MRTRKGKIIMRKHLSLLKNEYGVSVLFVLVVMMFLTAVGTTALVAASGGVGAYRNSEDSNRRFLLSDSIHRSVMHSMLECADEITGDTGRDILDSVNGPETFGGQLLGLIYKKAYETYLFGTEDLDGSPLIIGVSFEAELHPSLAEVDFTGVTVMLKVDASVELTPERWEPEIIFDDETGDPEEGPPIRTGQSAVIGTSTLLVTVNVDDRLTTAAEYSLSGAEIEDGGDPSEMLIADPGNWGFVSHKKIELPYGD